MGLRMTIVEVFKTNVLKKGEAKHLTAKLLSHFPQCKINFDLQDCDKILRVEGRQILPEKIVEVINGNGYQCKVLD